MMTSLEIVRIFRLKEAREEAGSAAEEIGRLNNRLDDCEVSRFAKCDVMFELSN